MEILERLKARDAEIVAKINEILADENAKLEYLRITFPTSSLIDVVSVMKCIPYTLYVESVYFVVTVNDYRSLSAWSKLKDIKRCVGEISITPESK